MFPVRIYDYTFGWVYVSSPAYVFLDMPELFDTYNVGEAYHDMSGWWGSWESMSNPARRESVLYMEGSC